MEEIIQYQTEAEQCNDCKYQGKDRSLVGEPLPYCDNINDPFNTYCMFANKDNDCNNFKKSLTKKILDKLFN